MVAQEGSGWLVAARLLGDALVAAGAAMLMVEQKAASEAKTATGLEAVGIALVSMVAGDGMGLVGGIVAMRALAKQASWAELLAMEIPQGVVVLP